MGRARLLNQKHLVINAAAYEKVKHGAVLCIDTHCLCAVEGVHATSRNVKGEQVHVDAFFRLPKNAEQNGTGHDPGCRFNVKNIVTKIVAESREIKTFDPDAAPLVATRNKRAEVRLHILMETLRWDSSIPVPEGERTPPSDQPPRGTRYVRSKHLLNPYLKSARAVLSFIAKIQDRPELASIFALKYGRETLSWGEFFYDLEEYCELFNYLSEHQRESHNERRPIAIAVEILREWEPKRARSGYWRILARAFRCSSENNGLFAIRPVLYVLDKDLAFNIAKMPFILACALPKLGDLQAPQKPGLSPCADVSLNIVDPTRVCRYRPMSKD